jgi:WD40 repeat protein
LLANASHNRNEVLDLDFHPAGGLFVTAAFDAARCWTLPEGKLAMPPLKHRGTVWSVDYSPDGEQIVTASADKTAQIWDSHTGKPLFNPLRHTKELFLAAFSPDSRRILTTSEDGTARVWNAETGEPVSPFVRHDASVWRGAFSPDGRMVATASIGKMARIWDPETGLPMSEPITDDSVGRLMFSPDGRRLLTFGSEARLWDAIVPPTPVPLWFCELVEAVSGFRQASDGQLLGTTPDAIATARLRVVKGTQHDFYSRWAKWFLVDRMQESVSAFRAESKGPP